ncbi:hypothetical protein [Micromonospora sp. DT233]|uniref:hypothetical protein n=1 Tax=Micromonospora sp. DT233 TaxID=3393432 RepID=UPI003CEABA69
MSRPGAHLGRTYVLLFVLLGAIGLNAGWIAALSYGIGEGLGFNVCTANGGDWWRASDLAAADAARRDVAACMRSVTGPWLLAMLAGAAIAYAVTVLLAVAGAVRVRRLVRGAGRAAGPGVDVATVRFAELCGEHGVAERRPELFVLRAGARFTEPFTTGVPAGRPMVVVPAAAVSAGLDVFDPIVRHELAHVRARDGLLAAGAWWSGWAGVLLTVVAAAPFLASGRGSAVEYWAGLLVAVALGGLLVLLRAHVLRLRELAADQVTALYSARPTALAEVLYAARGAGRRPPGRLSALLSVRLEPADRVRAMTTGSAGIDGGFLPSAVTVFVFFIAVQPVNQAFMNWGGWAGPPFQVLYAIAAGLVAAMLMPAWARRYAAHPRASRWPPVLGVTVGGAAGFFLPGPGLPASPGTMALAAHWAIGPLLTLALAGIAVLLVALAHGVDPYRRRWLLAATVAGAGVAAVTVGTAMLAAIVWTGKLLAGASGTFTPTSLRMMVLYGEALWDVEPIVVFVVVAVLAVVAARSAPRPRPAPQPALPLLAAVAVTVGAIGSVVTALRLSGDGESGTDLPLLWQRWWVSALAGVVVLVVLLTRPTAGRTATGRVAGALTAAAGVTVVGALGQFAVRTVATGWDADLQPWLLRHYVIVPLRLLLLLSVVAVPVGLALARRSRPAWARPGRLRTPFAAAGTAIVSLAVMLGSGEMVVGGAADARELAVKVGPSATPVVITPVLPPVNGVLTLAQARQAVDGAGAVLLTWRVDPASSEDDDTQPSPCAAQSVAQAAVEPDVEATTNYSSSAESHPPYGAGITVTVESYRAAPDPETLFAPLRREAQACASYTQPNSNPNSYDHLSRMRLFIRQPVSIGHPALSIGLVRTDRVSPELAAVTTAHLSIVVVGHHVVTVVVVYAHVNDPPEGKLTPLDETARQALVTVVRALGG